VARGTRAKERADAEAATGPQESSLAERLIGHYALESDLYGAILELAQREGELLEAGDATSADVLTDCVALLERKDQLLKTIAQIETQVEPLKRRWWSEAVAPADRRRFNELLDDILGTLEALREQEQGNEQILLDSQQRVRSAPRGGPACRDADPAAALPSVACAEP
jgi:flagellar biosynthesis/type III secretory pathway chaperone